jgi:hypothetical protein
MVALKHSEMRLIEDAFDMRHGYVLDFSNQTFREFFEDEFGIDIYDEKYAVKGSSKANRLRAFIATEDAHMVTRVVRRLWDHLAGLLDLYPDYTKGAPRSFFKLLEKLEASSSAPRTDALYPFKQDETLDELIAAIERDIGANKPSAALDRLHILHEEVRSSTRSAADCLG